MTTKTRKTQKHETAEAKVERWIAGATKGFGYDDLMAAGWEPGQVAYTECHGLRYEKFALTTGGYVVVEWDEDGNVCC